MEYLSYGCLRFNLISRIKEHFFNIWNAKSNIFFRLILVIIVFLLFISQLDAAVPFFSLPKHFSCLLLKIIYDIWWQTYDAKSWNRSNNSKRYNCHLYILILNNQSFRAYTKYLFMVLKFNKTASKKKILDFSTLLTINKR